MPVETNDFIKQKLELGKPFFIGRLGDVECRLLMLNELKKHKIIKDYPNKIRVVAHKNAGMFSNDNIGIETFSNYFKESLSLVSGMCVWFNQMEDYLVEKYCVFLS